jgi:hypothetical protein
VPALVHGRQIQDLQNPNHTFNPNHSRIPVIARAHLQQRATTSTSIHCLSDLDLQIRWLNAQRSTRSLPDLRIL